MPAISDNLIHFLGRNYKDQPSQQFEIFKSIILNGLRCSEIQIKFGANGAVNNYVVCFTDIPLSHCDEHTAKYGKFGIGFKKSFIRNLGGNPARYFVDYISTLDENVIKSREFMLTNLCYHFDIVKTIKNLADKDKEFSLCDNHGRVLFKNEEIREWSIRQLTLLSFEKEMGDIGPARDDTPEMDQYYKEREWRLIPLNGNISSGCDSSRNLYYYKFERSDVNVVITPNNDMRVEVIKFFLNLHNENESRLKNFSSDLLPIVTYDDLKKW